MDDGASHQGYSTAQQGVGVQSHLGSVIIRAKELRWTSGVKEPSRGFVYVYGFNGAEQTQHCVFARDNSVYGA